MSLLLCCSDREQINLLRCRGLREQINLLRCCGDREQSDEAFSFFFQLFCEFVWYLACAYMEEF
jgi:hypothetical protein